MGKGNKAYLRFECCYRIIKSNRTTSMSDSAVLYGLLGAAGSLIFSGAGAAYGTFKSAKGMTKAEKKGSFVSAKVFVPVVIAGVLAIYGLIYSVIVSGQVNDEGYTMDQGYAAFAGGLGVGLSCLVAGIAVGVIAESGIPSAMESTRNFIGLCLLLIYAEAIGLYGLIFSLITSSSFSAVAVAM